MLCLFVLGAGRIVMASDGLWDSVKSNEAFKIIKKKTANDGAIMLAKEASKREGREGKRKRERKKERIMIVICRR